MGLSAQNWVSGKRGRAAVGTAAPQRTRCFPVATRLAVGELRAPAYGRGVGWKLRLVVQQMWDKWPITNLMSFRRLCIAFR